MAIASSTQWAGTVAVDRAGNPLMNAVIWMDMRGAKYVRGITRGSINIEGYGLLKLIQWIRLIGGVRWGSPGKIPSVTFY